MTAPPQTIVIVNLMIGQAYQKKKRMASKKIHFLLDTYAETRYHRGMAYTNDTGYPSVTQVLRPWVDTSWFTAESRARGTAVHDAVAQYLGGRPAFMVSLQPNWRGYFNSARWWIDAHVADVLMAEVRLQDDQWRYCGQPDLVARLRDGSIALVDWKTGAAARWHQLQIAGYRHLAKGAGVTTSRGMTIRLRDDGSAPLVDEHARNHEQDLNRLLGAVGLWWFFHPKRKEVKGEVED
jgi:hypothetical protein